MKCVAVESFENAIKWANVCLKIFEKSKNASFQVSTLIIFFQTLVFQEEGFIKLCISFK